MYMYSIRLTVSASPEPRLARSAWHWQKRIEYDRIHPASNSRPVSTASPLSLSHAGKFPPAQRIKAGNILALCSNARDDQGHSAPSDINLAIPEFRLQ